MRPLAPALLVAATTLLAGMAASAAAGPARQVVFSEDTTLHEARGTMWPGQERAFHVRVDEPNVTRLEVHLRWAGEDATFGITVTDPDGRAPAPPTRGDLGSLVLRVDDLHEVPEPVSVASRDEAEALARATSSEGQGEWRVDVTMDEESPEARDFTLVVIVYHYGAVPVRVVTMTGAADTLQAPPLGWSLALAGLAGLVAALGIRILTGGRRRREAPADASSVLPRGDNTPSPGTGQGRCAPEK